MQGRSRGKAKAEVLSPFAGTDGMPSVPSVMSELYTDEAVDVGKLACTKLAHVGDLLSVLHLGQWYQTFEAEGVDLPTLFFVTDENLITLGLTLSERIRLLRAIQLFKDVPPGANFKPAFVPVIPVVPMTMAHEERLEEEPVIDDDGDEQYADEEYEEEQAEEDGELERAMDQGQQEKAVELLETRATSMEEALEEIPTEGRGMPVRNNPPARSAALVGGATAAGLAAVAVTATVAANRLAAGAATKGNSCAFVRSSLGGGQSEKFGVLLQSALKGDLGIDRVEYLCSNDGPETISALTQFLDESTTPQDDMMWLVFSSDDGSEDPGELIPGLTFEELVECARQHYRGARVFIVLDGKFECAPDVQKQILATSLQHRPVMAVLSSCTPEEVNPCYMTLAIFDSLRGHLPAMQDTSRYRLEDLTAEVTDVVEFVGSCATVDILVRWVAEDGFDALDLDVVKVETLRSRKLGDTKSGKLGIASERPVQCTDINGPTRVQVRYLDDESDEEWVNVRDVQFEDDAENDESFRSNGEEDLEPQLQDNFAELAPIAVMGDEMNEMAVIEEMEENHDDEHFVEELEEQEQLEQEVMEEQAMEQGMMGEQVMEEEVMEEQRLEEQVMHEQAMEKQMLEEKSYEEEIFTAEELEMEEPIMDELIQPTELEVLQEEVMMMEDDFGDTQNHVRIGSPIDDMEMEHFADEEPLLEEQILQESPRSMANRQTSSGML